MTENRRPNRPFTDSERRALELAAERAGYPRLEMLTEAGLAAWRRFIWGQHQGVYGQDFYLRTAVTRLAGGLYKRP